MVTEALLQDYVSTVQAAQRLGCRRETVFCLVRAGKLPAGKLANRWLIPLKALEEFAKTYVPRVGRPRTKRKYTKRSPRWFTK